MYIKKVKLENYNPKVISIPNDKILKRHTRLIARNAQCMVIDTIHGVYINPHCHIIDNYSGTYLANLTKQ